MKRVIGRMLVLMKKAAEVVGVEVAGVVGVVGEVEGKAEGEAEAEEEEVGRQGVCPDHTFLIETEFGS